MNKKKCKPICEIRNTKVVDSRTKESKDYDWVPENIRYRKRKCNRCGSLTETYEGTTDDLFEQFKGRFKAMLKNRNDNSL